MSGRSNGESIRTVIYWFRVSWQRARSAYVADPDDHPDAPVGLLGWLHRAIAEHAARTPVGGLRSPTRPRNSKYRIRDTVEVLVGPVIG